jgi:hypothetical protein
MSSPPATIDFVRYSGRRGAIWLKDAAAMLSHARIPWLMLLLFYYLIQLLVSVIPLAGPLAMMVLRPVFTVGFLAAAWTQERGGTPEIRHLFRGFGANLWALIPIGIVLILGTTLAVLSTALVDGRGVARGDHVQYEARRRPRGQFAHRKRDADGDPGRAPDAARDLVRAGAGRVPRLRTGPGDDDEPAGGACQLATCRGLRPSAVLLRRGAAGMAIAIISLVVPPTIVPYAIALTVVPYVFLSWPRRRSPTTSPTATSSTPARRATRRSPPSPENAVALGWAWSDAD